MSSILNIAKQKERTYVGCLDAVATSSASSSSRRSGDDRFSAVSLPTMEQTRAAAAQNPSKRPFYFYNKNNKKVNILEK